MIERILIAVDDSAPALAAAAFGIELARSLGAELLVMTVDEPGRDPAAILGHVRSLGATEDVSPSVMIARDGRPPFEAILGAVVDHQVDLVVMGRSDRRSIGEPYVGSQTEHLLEFAEVPVVVVPESRLADRHRQAGHHG